MKDASAHEFERSRKDDLAASIREVVGPPSDEIDNALRTLTEAARILKDGSLMTAVRERLREQRAAIEKGPDDE